MKRQKRTYLTEQNKADILKLFYRTELREDETVINNSDRQIADELGLKYNNVCQYLVSHSKKQIDSFKNKYRI